MQQPWLCSRTGTSGIMYCSVSTATVKCKGSLDLLGSHYMESEELLSPDGEGELVSLVVSMWSSLGLSGTLWPDSVFCEVPHGHCTSRSAGACP